MDGRTQQRVQYRLHSFNVIVFSAHTHIFAKYLCCFLKEANE